MLTATCVISCEFMGDRNLMLLLIVSQLFAVGSCRLMAQVVQLWCYQQLGPKFINNSYANAVSSIVAASYVGSLAKVKNDLNLP